MKSLYLFITVAFVISFIDWKYQIIPDAVMFPSIFLLILFKWLDMSLSAYDFIAAGTVMVIFLIPLLFNMEFGGGDLRFGIFGALFVGLENLGYFVIVSGVLHLMLLGLKRQRTFGFAPAMSFAALGVYAI